MTFQDEKNPGQRADSVQDADTAPAAPETVPPEVDAQAAVAQMLVRLQTERDALAAKYNAAIRQLADLDNARKRIERERRDDAARHTAHVIESVLPVLDAFEHALAAHSEPAYEDYRKGFELICRQLMDSLARFGLTRIEAVGKPFDPHLHQAIERVESEDHHDGTVLADLRYGYKLRERVLRPALVRVAVKPAPKESEPAHAPAESDTPVN